MKQLHFFRDQEINPPILKKNGTPSVWRGLFLLCFWVLSIGNMWSQPSGGNSQQNILAPNISYSTPQNYLLSTAITNLAPTNSGGSIPAATYKQVSTFAGTTSGFLDGTVATAKMYGPLGMTMDANGDIYFIDSANFLIRKMTTTLQAGISTTTITTIAGDGYSWLFYGRLLNNATGTSASFNYPTDIALDTANKCLYVTDKENDVIRKVSLADNNHTVTTFAGSGTSVSTDGTGLLAKFKKPSGIAIDPTGTYLYVTDRTGNKIRRITISTAQVITIAGSGTAGTTDSTTGTTATFNAPTGIAVDANYIYVTDFSGNKIRKISTSGLYPVTTIAGSGTSGSSDNTNGALATTATFNNPYGLTLDPAGNLFVAEWGNKIRKITPDGVVTTFAGSGTASSVDGNGANATFNNPSNIVISPTSGFGYVSEYTGNRIRKIELGGYELPSSPALPTGISFDVTTGTFSGTPTAINNGPVSYTITGYNYYGSSTATVSITSGFLPFVDYTDDVYDITATSATSGGFVNENGISPLTIEGGGAPTPLTEKGICWSTSVNPTVLDSKVASSDRMTDTFTNNLTGLTPLTTYYVRAYATTGLGTAYGNQVSFTTKMQAPVISYNTTNVFAVNTTITPLQVSSTGGLVSGLAVPTVSTFAGSYPTGFVNGNGTAAKFQGPSNLATDTFGNVYVADTGNNTIRKITTDGVVSSLATGLNSPTGVATDSAGNVYVTDTNNNQIRKISPFGDSNLIAGTGFAGSENNANALGASFRGPAGIAVDASGNVYVADARNYVIRKIAPTGNVTTLAGSVGVTGSIDGTGTNASFTTITDIATDVLGNVYVNDFNKQLIRKITPSGVVSTLAGNQIAGSADGTGTEASFWNPRGVTVDASGNIYVADFNNNKIRKITPAGVVTTLAGTGTKSSVDGIGTEATFSNPTGITVDASGNLYVSEGYTSLIRKISFLGFSISPALPAGLVLNADGSITGTPTVLSAAKDYVITATNAGGSSSTTVNIAVAIAAPAISYTASNQFPVNTAITALQVTNTGGVIPSELKGIVSTFAGSGTAGATDGTGIAASFKNPYGITMDVTGNFYVADYNNNSIRKITPSGAVSTFAGSGIQGATDGSGTSASFNQPSGVAVDATGNIYVADRSNHLIRKINAAGVVTTFAGSGIYGETDGTGSLASFNNPTGLAVDAVGNVFVADSNNNKIRKITPAGVVSTFAGSGVYSAIDGTGTAATFAYPSSVAVDGADNVYVTDRDNHKIRKITPTGVVTTLAGSGVQGATNGTGTAASFKYPYGVILDAIGNLYVADAYGYKIRKITGAGVVTTLAGIGISGVTDGSVSDASFNLPFGVALDLAGNVFVAEYSNHKIRKITQYGYSVSPALPAGLVLNADGSISGTPTVVSPATDYVITATNARGSASYTVNIAVTTALGIVQDAYSKAIVAYPSPFSDTFKIDVATNNSDAITIAIYDMIGKKLESQNGTPTEINNLELGYNYPAGVYNVIVTQGSEVKILRVIKK